MIPNYEDVFETVRQNPYAIGGIVAVFLFILSLICCRRLYQKICPCCCGRYYTNDYDPERSGRTAHIYGTPDQYSYANYADKQAPTIKALNQVANTENLIGKILQKHK